MSTLDKRLEVLERRGGGGTSQCVLFPSLDEDAPPSPPLCPHGRPWSIKVVYDDLTDAELMTYREDLSVRLRRQGVDVPPMPDVTAMSDDELATYRATLDAQRHARRETGHDHVG